MELRRGFIALALVGSSIVGGAIGATVFSAGAAGAATPSTPTAPVPFGGGGSGAPGGTWHPNEDPTHEKSESAAREAQENAWVQQQGTSGSSSSSSSPTTN